MFYNEAVARVEYLEQPCRNALNAVKGMGFKWSLNPYMGCVHRCTFCYVRHFERRADRPSDDRYGRAIRVKTNVVEVLRRELARASWQREHVAIGAATDPYQPAEGRYRLTRGCIEAPARPARPGSGRTSSSCGRGRASTSSRTSPGTGPRSSSGTSACTPGAPISAPRTRSRCALWSRSWPGSTRSGTAAGGRPSRRRSPSSCHWPSSYVQSPGLSTNAPGPNGKEITCLIVDDHEVVREGLRLSLSRAPHIRVVGEASDGASAVELAERRKPDVVIMDVRMPGMDGLEATKLLTEKVPESKVLIFTAYSERSLLGRGLESGAKGYILKEAPHQTLVPAIEKVAQGEGY